MKHHWDQITKRIHDRSYRTIDEFLIDIQPLVNALKTVMKTFDINLFREVLNPKKSLNEIRGIKVDINGPQELINIIREDRISTSIVRVFQSGQIAGRNAQRINGLPGLKSIPVTSTSQESTKTLLFNRESQQPPFEFCFAHEKYYGVWVNPHTQKFIAQVKQDFELQ